jgi:hypothetical protein
VAQVVNAKKRVQHHDFEIKRWVRQIEMQFSMPRRLPETKGSEK